MKRDPIRISIAGDANYWMPMTVLLASIFANNPQAEIAVYLLYLESAVGEPDLAGLEAFIVGHGGRMHRLPVTDDQLGHTPGSRRFRSTYLRLLLPKLLPESVEKVLYLDGDIVVCGDLKPLYDTDLGESYAAAVKDPTTLYGRDYCRSIGIPDQAQYVNTGVLLMNIARMRREGITEAFFDYLPRYADFQFSDQDVLNGVLWPAMKCVSPVYNYNFWTERDVARQLFTADELAAVRRRPVIVHYIGPVKPWHYKSIHPHKKLWWKYLKLTSYKDFRAAPATAGERLNAFFLRTVIAPLKPHLTLRRKQALGRLLPAGIRKILRRKLFKAQ